MSGHATRMKSTTTRNFTITVTRSSSSNNSSGEKSSGFHGHVKRDIMWLIAVNLAASSNYDTPAYFWKEVDALVLRKHSNVSLSEAQEAFKLEGSYYSDAYSAALTTQLPLSFFPSKDPTTAARPLKEIPKIVSRFNWTLTKDQWSVVKSVCDYYDPRPENVERRLVLTRIALEFKYSDGFEVTHDQLFSYYRRINAKGFGKKKKTFPLGELYYGGLTREFAKGQKKLGKIFKGAIFTVFLLNKNWITIAESAKLEYLITLHGGHVKEPDAVGDNDEEEERTLPPSSPIVVICVGESKSAAVRALKKWGKLYSPLLVETAIKARSFIASNLEEFVFHVDALTEDEQMVIDDNEDEG